MTSKKADNRGKPVYEQEVQNTDLEEHTYRFYERGGVLMLSSEW